MGTDALLHAAVFAQGALALLLAVAGHEAAHAITAYACGDDTAVRAGRATLNPVAHMELLGSIIVPVLTFLIVGVSAGWAKPLPFDSRKLRHPRRDEALIAAAGPAANAAMALIWWALGHLDAWTVIAGYGLASNLAMMIFNLAPIPPFDGWRIVRAMRDS